MKVGKFFTYRTLLYLSIGLYVACFPFGAVCTSDANCHSSWGILLFGWFPFLANPFLINHLIWGANLLLFMAWPGLTGANGKWWDIGFSLFILAVGASFLLVRTVVDNEGGVANPVVGYGIGYWLWLGSMATLVVAAVVKHYPKRASIV